jgi:hypothetical protein
MFPEGTRALKSMTLMADLQVGQHLASGLRGKRISPCRLRIRAILLCGLVLLCGNGCATTSYRFGRFHPETPDGTNVQPVVVKQGTPHKTLDRFARIVGIPGQFFTLNKKTNNHDVSPETIDKVKTYLERNDITDVLVAVNDYDPKGQWQRMRENDRISPLWRYTAGTLNWLGYVIIPNRVFGGDEYNPFTNTMTLTSDVPSLVLAEAAYAKDIRSQKNPGAYAAINDLPVLSLIRHSKATSDVLGYARFEHDWEAEKEAYDVLYPQIGSTTFGPASHFVPVAGPFLSVGGAVVGHAAGRSVAKVQEPKPIRTSPGPSSSPEAVSALEEIASTHRRRSESLE